MISGTTVSGLRALIFLGQQAPTVLPPRKIAAELGESPTYLSKVTTQLVKAGVLRAEKGVKGGVQLARPAPEITMLDVVEACQGTVVGPYCRAACLGSEVCAFHQAAQQLETAICDALRRWSLADLLRRPSRKRPLADGFECVMLPALIAAGSKARAAGGA
jgi:Rrf2 family protein